MNALAPVRPFHQLPWFWAAMLLLWLAVLAVFAGYDGLYGQDAYAHLNYARDIQALWRDRIPLGSYQWPRLYAFLGALWVWGDPRLWMQFLSMLGATVTLAMVVKLLQRHQPDSRWAAPLAFAFVGLSPILIRNSLSIMADAPALAMMTAGLWMGMRYEETGKSGQLGWAAFFTGGAIMLRYPVALLMLIPMLSWLRAAIRKREWLGFVLFLPNFLMPALPQLLLPAAAGEGLTQPFQHQHFIQWNPLNYFGNSFVQQDGQNAYPVFNLLAALGMFWHPRYLGLGCLAVLGVFWRKRLQLPRFQLCELLKSSQSSHNYQGLAAVAIGINVLFLAGIPYQNPRFLLPMLPFVALILGPVWNGVWERLMKANWLRGAGFALLVMVQLGLGMWSAKLLFSVNANERAIAAYLSEPPHAGRRLYELSFQAMLEARNVPLEAVSMWDGPVPPPREGDLVLFNLKAFAQQFEGMWPMKNWDFLREGHELVPRKEWRDGWTLYEIH